MYRQTWLDKLERKCGRFAIPGLMNAVVFGMGLVFIIDLVTAANPDNTFTLSQLLYFDREAILHGQVWRVLTFALLPPSSSPFWIVLSLYFYWLIGSALEAQWGTFKFNVYYFSGILFNILSGMLTGSAWNTYLNMTLFLAFAVIFPNFEMLLFFVLPIKVKYLALVDAFFLVAALVYNSWPGRLSVLVSVLNFVLFFWRDGYDIIRREIRRQQNKRKWKRR
ncbi:MAG: hypothetical protein IJ055_00885 [Oscillospiraceae bacterium]|nr:hypothetical protein [Oscillospiraceae bacterium]